MSVRIIYGPGGYDPGKPDNNALERWDDGTRTYTDFRATPDVVRPYTAAENAEADQRAAEGSRTTNGEAIRSNALTALTSNRNLLGIASPTSAQNAAQVKALTRQVNGLIRLALDKLDGTD